MKKLLIFMFSVLYGIMSMSAQYNAKPIGIYLIDHENVHLQGGGIEATEGKIKDDMYGARIYADLKATGWPVKDDWSNLKFIMKVNGEEIEIDPHSLNNGSPYTYFNVNTSGNTSYISFSYLFYTPSWDDIYSITWDVKCYYNGNWHHCEIGVRYGGIITEVPDIQLNKQDNTIYDLQGRVLREKPNGLYIQNGKLHR